VSRKFAVVVIAVASALTVGAPAAWGHAEFDQKNARANAEQGFSLKVPEERGDKLHNTKVVLAVPDGWTATRCEDKASWGCAISPASSGRPAVVTWTRQSPGGDEVFRLSLRTGARGRVSVPVHQTYSDGQTMRWDGPEDSEYPAPVIEIR
jgi:uncharacterized protein YcnI